MTRSTNILIIINIIIIITEPRSFQWHDLVNMQFTNSKNSIPQHEICCVKCYQNCLQLVLPHNVRDSVMSERR